MASTKALRDTYGLSQQEIAYFIGARRFQVAHHERTGRNLSDAQEQVLKRLVILFQQYKDKPELPDVRNLHQASKIRESLNEDIGDLKFKLKGNYRELARLRATYLNIKILLEVLKQLMGELPSQEGNLFDCLMRINSIIQRKMRLYGPEEQLLLTIKIKSHLKQIEVNEDFLNHELLKN